MQLELGLMALACLLTQKVVPRSQLIFPALGMVSAAFFQDPKYQVILVAFGCLLWVMVQRD